MNWVIFLDGIWEGMMTGAKDVPGDIPAVNEGQERDREVSSVSYGRNIAVSSGRASGCLHPASCFRAKEQRANPP